MAATDEERREAAAALEALNRAGVTVRRVKRDKTRQGLDQEPDPIRSSSSPGETAAAESLPIYTGPAPTTLEEAAALMDGVGTQHGGLSPEVEAAIITLQAEALEAGEGGAVDDRTEPNQFEPTQAPPVKKARPVPKPTGAGLEFPLWGDVILKVYPETRGAYPVEILRGEGRIWIDAPKSPPWLSTRLQDALITGLTGAVEDEGRSREFVKKKVAETFAAIAERLETDDETRRALTPAPVRRLMEETESVIVYPGEATFYEVTIAGRTLTITAAQMARVEPGFINAAVLNAFPLDPLDASKSDWKAIKDYWLSPDVAEVRDREETTAAEIVIERLRLHCEGLTLVASPDALTADTSAWNDESDRLVWIPGTWIARFVVDELKKPAEWTSELSKILRGAGQMLRPTKTIRTGPASKQVRCWGLKEDFAKFKTPAGGMQVRDALIARRESK